MVCFHLVRRIKRFLCLSLKLVTTSVDDWQKRAFREERSAVNKHFAHLLQSYIDGSGIKRTHVAAVAGISYNYLTRLLSGTRRPSDQVVFSLARALHLSGEQTAELFAAAGFPPPVALLADGEHLQTDALVPTPPLEAPNQANRLTQQWYRLVQDVPERLRAPFLEEMRCLLGYARYKYILSGGTSPLELERTLMLSEAPHAFSGDQAHLDSIAQILGELRAGGSESAEATQQMAEDTLSTIDHLIGNLLSGEVSASTYHPELVTQTLEMLREGTPWEIRRRIAEALPALCRLDIAGTERLMDALRTDLDERRGPDIRRRVIEALPALFGVAPQSLPTIVRLLQPRPDDDIYVALATVEACGDIQAGARYLLEHREGRAAPELDEQIACQLPDIARIQRALLAGRQGVEQESLQFSMALHNLLPAPDTLLISLREGIGSREMLIQLVTVRYLERILPARPAEALQLYELLLRGETQKNVRRPVAKALPALLHCLKETSLPVRALARSIIIALAGDSDVPIRRAVADHAMQIFAIDREFLLVLLKRMQKETDPAIRHRLRPVALQLAEVWLIWYAETAGLVDMNRRGHVQVVKQPFGE